MSVSFSPDGKFIVSGSRDKTVRVWDATNGVEVGMNSWSLRYFDFMCFDQVNKLEGHSRDVTSVSFSPDGKFIVSGSWDETVRVWDATNGVEVG